MNKGKVYLVGAGPGDPELLTLKAKRLLEEADCVVYDYLAEKNFVRGLRAEVIYVGKQGSDHTLTQDEINDLIVKKALDGMNVVRLKGGDPYIFGRGGEEAEILLENGISFEVVPGISSFYSAPAYGGIPLTHRDFSNSFEVITGHRRSDSDDGEDVNFPEYDPEKTFVFLMGMKNLDHIRQQLIEIRNFPEDIPVGIISWGTRPEQQVITAPLKEIVEEVGKSGIKPPAIIIMGGVVSLRDKLRWFDNRPLFGKKIVVTRTRNQSSVMAAKLSSLGARVIEFPTIEIEPAGDMSKLHEAIDNIGTYDWLVFTSQNGIEIFFRELFSKSMDVRALGSLKIGVIGKATEDELKKYGLRADVVPEKYVQESLLESMVSAGVSGKKILLPCASEAREDLSSGLVNAGAVLNRINIYSAVKPSDIDRDLIEDVKNADMITFASSSTAKNFFEIVPNINGELASIGPVTTETILKLGHKVSVDASVYTIPGLIEAMVEYYKQK